ncbi:MAG: hypothetical protein M1371_00425 [Actinobacteria bacterium]|nr:hypothetical protein [Actinomycetota bacterium]
MRFSLISPYEKLDQKILGIFDALGDLTIFTWGMPEIEIVYSDDTGKHHVSSMPLEKYDSIVNIYPFDCNLIAVGNESAFDESIRFFKKVKGKVKIFFISYDDFNFYSLYRGLGGMRNIDEIMALSILDFGVFGKKLVQIVKDNESEEIAKSLLEEISLMNYLLKYSAGCLVVGEAFYNELIETINHFYEDDETPYLIKCLFKLDDEAKAKLHRWLVDGEYTTGKNKEDRADFQFIMHAVSDVLTQKEYRDLLVDDVIRDMVRDIKEML